MRLHAGPRLKITCKLALGLSCLLVCGAEALAQNIVPNPYFDAGLDYWQALAPERVMWTNTMDHHVDDSTAIGSAQLDSREGLAVLAQCVPINEMTYVGSVWVNSVCAGQSLQVYWTDDSCTVGLENASAVSTVAGEWQLITATGNPTPGSTHAVVTLVNPSACGNTAYFDVVTLQPDEIFADNFEAGL